MKIQFKRLPHGEGLPLPAYASEGAAALDIRAATRTEVSEGRWVFEGTIEKIPTGFAVAVPEGYELQVRPRSGLAANHGITITNSPGTVDSDYRGEIIILVHNLGNKHFYVDHGDRIAQLVLAPVVQAQVEEVEELSETERGTGGFGSTGRN